MSPEVLEGKYDKRCDLWSLGVITYLLVVGYPPFNGENDAEVFFKIRCCDYSFPEKEGGEYILSEEIMDFMSSLLNTDPERRITIDQALNHPWI